MNEILQLFLGQLFLVPIVVVAFSGNVGVYRASPSMQRESFQMRSGWLTPMFSTNSKTDSASDFSNGVGDVKCHEEIVLQAMEQQIHRKRLSLGAFF